MRLPADAAFRFLAVSLLEIGLAGCTILGRGDRPALQALAAANPQGVGPSADYPMVLGEPFTVDGQSYTPADTMNYDAVGYTALDDGAGVTVAHRTLPLPSYVEVTSLVTGKTILARVERRGPMAGASLVALSPGAVAQLEAGENAPVRVRRVNPPETDRLELRSGRSAVTRIETPKSLVEVLRRKLPASGWLDLRAPIAPRPALAKAVAPPAMAAKGEQRALDALVPTHSAISVVAAAQSTSPKAVSAYPLPALTSGPAKPKPVVVARVEPASVAFKLAQPQRVAATAMAQPTVVKPASPSATASAEGFVVQAGTFSSSENAQRAAKALGGFVSPAGKFFRVRTGPFEDRGKADAALAKVRAAGYSDARVHTAG